MYVWNKDLDSFSILSLSRKAFEILVNKRNVSAPHVTPFLQTNMMPSVVTSDMSDAHGYRI